MVNKISSISIKRKEQLKKKINNLDYNEQCEIFNIIRKDTDKISENNNGIFINLKYLKDETMEKLFNFVDYCDQNKLFFKNDKDKLFNQNNNNNFYQIKNINSDISSSKSDDTYIDEDLSDGFQSYIIENDEYFNNTKNNKINDKFSFKTYIDKLSVSSQKNFSEKNEKKTPILKNKKLKLTGVKARIMNKCRNINKNTNNYYNKNKSNISHKIKKIEDIIDDNISELDKASYISDIEFDIENDSYDTDELESTNSNELQEDLL